MSYRAAARCVRRAHPRALLARVSAVGGGSPASARRAPVVRAPSVRPAMGEASAPAAFRGCGLRLRHLRRRPGRAIHEGGYLPFSFDITEALRAEKTAGEGSAEARFQGAEAMTGDVAVEGAGDAKSDACGEGKADLEEAADLAPALPRGVRAVALCVSRPERCGTQPRGKQRLKSGGIWQGPKRHLAAGVDGKSFPLAACWPWRCIRCRCRHSDGGCRCERRRGPGAHLRLRPDGLPGGRRRRRRRVTGAGGG